MGYCIGHDGIIEMFAINKFAEDHDYKNRSKYHLNDFYEFLPNK
jgi:hypothetical protein